MDPRQHINQPVHESASLSKLNQGPIQLPTSFVWNNSGKETVTLKSASGKTIDSRGYTGKSVSGAARVFYKP